jgi:hypothetical protein
MRCGLLVGLLNRWHGVETGELPRKGLLGIGSGSSGTVLGLGGSPQNLDAERGAASQDARLFWAPGLREQLCVRFTIFVDLDYARYEACEALALGFDPKGRGTLRVSRERRLAGELKTARRLLPKAAAGRSKAGL